MTTNYRAMPRETCPAVIISYDNPLAEKFFDFLGINYYSITIADTSAHRFFPDACLLKISAPIVTQHSPPDNYPTPSKMTHVSRQ